jgi:hypothetical protein
LIAIALFLVHACVVVNSPRRSRAIYQDGDVIIKTTTTTTIDDAITAS